MQRDVKSDDDASNLGIMKLGGLSCSSAITFSHHFRLVLTSQPTPPSAVNARESIIHDLASNMDTVCHVDLDTPDRLARHHDLPLSTSYRQAF